FGFPTKNLSDEWRQVLDPVLSLPASRELAKRLKEEADSGKVIYPDRERWFHALEACPLSEVKVVILGQDPYHGPGQAHGLAFSVRPGIKAPPSLQNIFKELAKETQSHAGDMDPFLDRWA